GHEIVNVVAVGGERESVVDHFRGLENLHIALSGHLTHPKALLAVHAQRVNDVFAVWRNHSMARLAGSCETGDLHRLEGWPGRLWCAPSSDTIDCIPQAAEHHHKRDRSCDNTLPVTLGQIGHDVGVRCSLLAGDTA